MAIRVLPLDATIRAALPSDEDFLVALSARVFRPYSDHPARAMRRLLRSQTGEVFVAVHGETHLGFVVVHIEALGRDFGPLARPSVAHLDAIAVRPNLSSHGLGRRLLAYGEAFARANGAVSMSLLTAETNTDAQRMFLAAGYQMLAPIDGVYTGGQRAYSMFKPLSSVTL
ncbi:MAG TPA: GNAT family N-acetyltransferase [Labilithrix sp.]|nr:GNAT family N-acetyltransferase [Labilithrix sp.]